MPPPVPPEARRRVAELISAARADGRRRLLGIVGAPGAGKSAMATRLASVEGATVVGMDGWHLAGSALEALGRVERKGAPDTFDAAGYVAFLERVRADDGGTVWAPEFRREIEEPVAGALAVGPQVRLLVTEGNYLLLDDGPWARVRPLLDEVWFLAPEERHRRARLIARHERHGRRHDDAVARADGSDADNARLIDATRDRADLVLEG